MIFSRWKYQEWSRRL